MHGSDGDRRKAEKRKKAGGGKRRVRSDGERHHHPKDSEQYSGDAAEESLYRRAAAGFDAFQIHPDLDSAGRLEVYENLGKQMLAYYNELFLEFKMHQKSLSRRCPLQ
ncbi:hypothetical protein IC803_13580 [Geobacillus sp. 46C-IIa]|nr:hypothetical protein IC803_13580 [Geobacillus sp. 46C-IIa]